MPNLKVLNNCQNITTDKNGYKYYEKRLYQRRK